MPQIKFKEILSFSSEDPKYPVENIIRQKGPWCCNSTDSSGELSVELKLEKASIISFADVGNFGSGLLRIEVGRSSWTESEKYKPFLPTVVLMCLKDWKDNKNFNTVRMFKNEDFEESTRNEKWDKIRIVCTQPYKRGVQFGLSFLKISTKEVTKVALFYELDISPSIHEKRKELTASVAKKTLFPQHPSKSFQKTEESLLKPHENYLIRDAFSPVSRAARLVAAGSSLIQKKMTADRKKEIECNALEFLISLDSRMTKPLSSSYLFEEFRKLTQSSFNQEERLVFLKITKDFMSKKYNYSECELSTNTKTDISTPNETTSISNKTPSAKKVFTFRKIGATQGTANKIFENNEDTVQENIHDCANSLDVPLSSFNSQIVKKRSFSDRCNEEILNCDTSVSNENLSQTKDFHDSAVTTLQNRKKKAKKSEIIMESGIWFDPKDDKSKLHKLNAMGQNKNKTLFNFSLESANYSNFGFRENKPKIKDNIQVIDIDGDIHMVMCPICSEFFEDHEVERHASSCNGDTTSTKSAKNEITKCPICSQYITKSKIEEHADQCAELNLL